MLITTNGNTYEVSDERELRYLLFLLANGYNGFALAYYGYAGRSSVSAA